VAVIDQGLPDGLGIDLLKEAAKLRPFMGLILYTVRNDYGMQYTAKVLGAKYLSKPASRLGLGETVKAAAARMTEQDFTGPRKLLIAEDTESVRDVLRRQLQKLGVEADFVTTVLKPCVHLSARNTAFYSPTCICPIWMAINWWPISVQRKKRTISTA
jgi:DNA-binding response OmpR family regulator